MNKKIIALILSSALVLSGTGLFFDVSNSAGISNENSGYYSYIENTGSTGRTFSVVRESIGESSGELTLASGSSSTLTASKSSSTSFSYSIDFMNDAESSGISYSDENDAIAYLRDSLVARESTISFSLTLSSDEVDDDFSSVVIELMDYALSEEYSVSSSTGDYLAWSIGGYSASYNAKLSGKSDYRISFTYSPYYYTDAEKEADVDLFVSEAVEDLALTDESVSVLSKLIAIHDLICETTTYDQDASDIDFYSYSSSVDYTPFTAYGAISGSCVCQGYSTLFYKMCIESGIPCRIIVSETHAWNIVSLDGGSTYYHIDLTWDDTINDSEGISTAHKYFLKGDEDLDTKTTSHDKTSDYTTEEFISAYPISDTAYYLYECNDSETHTVICPYCGDIEDEAESHTFTVTESDDYYVTMICTECGYESVVTVEEYENTVKANSLSSSTPKIKKAKRLSAKKIKINIKKVKYADGYIVKFCRKKSGKKVFFTKTTSNRKLTIKSKKFRKYKKIYVRVRAYANISGKTYKSSWSSVKKIKNN